MLSAILPALWQISNIVSNFAGKSAILLAILLFQQYCWQYCSLFSNIAGNIVYYSAILLAILLIIQQYCWLNCWLLIFFAIIEFWKAIATKKGQFPTQGQIPWRGTPTILDSPTFWHLIFWHPNILTLRHFDNKKFCHPDIVPPKKLCHCIQIKTFWHPDILLPRHFATPVIWHPDTQTQKNQFICGHCR